MGSDREYLRESLRERIHLDHLSYLGLDESPSKIAKWSQLECLVEEFLSVVPQREKFYNQEVLLVLSDSASTSHFSAYKAAAAFQCIEKYATNLLCQPWRKEYLTIQVYSGYYKHMIEGPLPLAEVIFQAMGYLRPSESGLVMREPLDPDNIARVALDCLMAVVECQIMVRLWEENKGSSWSEVYHVRQAHVGSVEQSLRMLKLQEKPAEGVLIDISNGFPNRKETKRINIQGFTLSRSSPAQTHSELRDEPTMYTTSPYMSPTIPCWPHWDFIPAYPMVPSIPITAQMRDITIPPSKAKSQKKMKADVQKKVFELPVADPVTHSTMRERKLEMYDNVDNEKDWTKIDSYSNDCKSIFPEALVKIDTKHNKKTHKALEEIWFVDKNPVLAEMQVSFNVDLNHKKLDRHTNVEKKAPSMQAQSLDIDKNEMKLGSWSTERIPMFTETLPTQHLDLDKNGLEGLFGEQRVTDTESSDHEKIKNKLQSWSCPFCTYLNAAHNDICDICSRSKGLNESVHQLKSGGRQCPKCTLVNDSKAQICSACDESLKDSPTYI